MRQHVWLKVMKASVGTIGLAGLIAFGGSVTASALSGASTPTVSGSAPAVGYHLADADGGVFNFGASGFYGSTYSDGLTGFTDSHPLSAPIVGIAEMASGKGYWMVGADGGVFNFGDAAFYGNTYSDGLTGLTGSHPLGSPVVGIAPTPDGKGYWLVTKAGHVYGFGDASFYGDTYSDGLTGLTGSHPLNAPIVGIQSTPDGKGYWMVGADGGVFNFGNAAFYVSTYSDGLSGLIGSHPLVSAVVGMVPTANGQGYWLVTKTGFICDFGSANFLGDSSSLGLTGLGGPTPLAAPIVGIAE
ncbi:hypothetical protein [Ferrimicrobium acidiphilum]|uniref:Uncharacterized protein n=1 Tax=Ferrimicrobium acidiphilum DSM 19497 TaxID=1121877 RepID=A0A0D8FRF1_9ACTN|nr:hypothetical protein [Ferrimicrobium acidiphilum]KJE75549.1 hypothetical protein FEAC_26900 [Ferrimicrobium acidiphilum DSM 19497]